MRIATWNVNSIKARLPRVVEWLGAAAPDVVCLQETKCEDQNFPAMEIEDLGYNIAIHGQKSYNGVAILSKRPIEDVQTGLPGDDGDEQARYIEATVDGVRICGLYLPNGNPVPGPKFDYKLGWMDRLIGRAQELLSLEETFIMAGDYNVCPTDDDVFDPAGFADDALCQPESRNRFRQLLNLGLTDGVHVFNPQPHFYTYWDYQRGAWQKDHGLRIDHLLLSPQATDRLVASGVDKAPRGEPKASDHTPAWIELSEPDA
ncbi:exodeoxyribonuclease III [Minwuia thermotolerans]|uniref:Exodeoxyribonuclease III n=1 Tax=Minwuia thermotolerans TaxID=2056226 RepID=A0A2M9FXL8_9PROT|nr:exodeoxyribonuclease III [Minwuia thermotolerans]PJK28212.1 exodeoxyribonuclease III [Minwuia thermotolerans]